MSAIRLVLMLIAVGLAAVVVAQPEKRPPPDDGDRSVQSVSFAGNTLLSDQRLTEVIGFEPGDTNTKTMIDKAMANIDRSKAPGLDGLMFISSKLLSP